MVLKRMPLRLKVLQPACVVIFLIGLYMLILYAIIKKKKPSIFIRDKPILSSESILLHKEYDRKISVGKICGREPQGALRQDELICCKQPVVTSNLTLILPRNSCFSC
jgi:hypothetical protein